MSKLIDIIKNIYNIKELRDRILFTLGLLLVYRLCAQVVLPGVDSLALSDLSTRTDGGGLLGILNAFTGGALYTTFPTCADHAKWIQLGSAGWQAEVGPTYGAENTVSIGGMPGFQGKLTEDEIYAVVVFERVVFGGGDTEEVLIDCGLLETEEEEEAIREEKK